MQCDISPDGFLKSFPFSSIHPMATVIVPSPLQTVDRLFTAADLEFFPTDLPSGPIDYELDNGRLILMTPPGHAHGAAQARIATKFIVQAEEAGHGRAFTEVGVVLSRNPDTVLCPDVAFVGKSKLPVRESREGYLETIPDLVVEVRSKNDSRAELERKAAEYLSAGVAAVWIADPEAKTIGVHRAGSEPRIYSGSQTLESDEPIPGLRLNVADIFRG
jgi:Uma2 family endonuclease